MGKGGRSLTAYAAALLIFFLGIIPSTVNLDLQRYQMLDSCRHLAPHSAPTTKWVTFYPSHPNAAHLPIEGGQRPAGAKDKSPHYLPLMSITFGIFFLGAASVRWLYVRWERQDTGWRIQLSQASDTQLAADGGIHAPPIWKGLLVGSKRPVDAQHFQEDHHCPREPLQKTPAQDLEFVEGVVRLTLLFGGKGRLREIVNCLPCPPVGNYLQVLRAHPWHMHLWEEREAEETKERNTMMAAVVDEPLRHFDIVLPPLPHRGRVDCIHGLRRYGFVQGEEGRAFIPGSLLDGAFRDGGEQAPELQVGDWISYACTVDLLGRSRVSEMQLSQPNGTHADRHHHHRGNSLGDLQSALEAEDRMWTGSTSLQATPLVPFTANWLTGEVVLPDPLPRFRPPLMPIFLSKKLPRNRRARLGMQNLLRVIDMHQEDAAAHDVVCMCSTLLALLDMTVDAAGPDLRLAWAGGTESARGRRRRDRIIIQRCGSTLFLDQASVPFQSAPVSLATQLRRSCVEPSNPCVQAYLLGRVQLMGLRLLVASLPDAVMPDGRLMEIKLAHQLTPRDAVQCFLQGTRLYCHGIPTRVERDVAVLGLFQQPLPDIDRYRPYLHHLRRMLALIRRHATEDNVTYTLQRTVTGLTLSRIPVANGLAVWPEEKG